MNTLAWLSICPAAISGLGAETPKILRPAPLVGSPAPAFSLKNLDGKVASLSQFRGKTVVLHITATWCPYCAAEINGLVELDATYKDRSVQVIMVDVKEPRETVARVAAQYGVAFPVLLDPKGQMARKYCPPGAQPELERDEVALASNLIIDAEGIIRYFSLFSTGAYDAKLTELRKRLDALLPEAKP